MHQIRVLIVHNETMTRDGGDYHGDRFEGFDPSLSRTLLPRTELRFTADDTWTAEAIANRVWALANGHPDDGDEGLSNGYYKWARRSLSIGDLLGILRTPIDPLTGTIVPGHDWDAPVWLSIEGLGMKRHAPDQIPSSALAMLGLPIVDSNGPVY